MSAFDDQVREFIEEHEGMSFIAKAARRMYDAKEYEDLKVFMNKVGAEESQNHFQNTNQIVDNDTY